MKLLPHDTSFFDLFEQQGKKTVEGCKAFLEMVLNPTDNHPPGEHPHTTITCDGPLSFDYARNIAVFEQNVHIKDDQGDLYSDKLVAYLDQTTHAIRYAEATGRVRIVQGPHSASGARAVYEPAKSRVTLLDAPSLVVFPEQKTDIALFPPPHSKALLAPTAGAPASVDAKRTP